MRVSAFWLKVTDSGLFSGVRMVTLFAVCVIVNSNGFTCPLFGFCGRHVPDRFGGACADSPITQTATAATTLNIARFIFAPWRPCYTENSRFSRREVFFEELEGHPRSRGAPLSFLAATLHAM